jgi:hypothetical protein
VAVNDVVCPAQMVADERVAVGSGFTVTVTATVLLQRLVLVGVQVAV